MIKIPKTIYDEMIEHAKKIYPQEACGFLTGRGGEGTCYIPIENMDHSSVTYTMDPKQQMKAFKIMNERKLDLLGIFHSHVASSPEPSQTDRTMAFYPDISYLIVSLADMENPDLKSYKIDGDAVTSEELVIQ